MIRYITKYLILLLLGYNLSAQNLIPNNSFEEYKKCPELEGKLNKNVFNWYSPNQASPDYFNACSSNKLTSISINFGGSQLPHSGNAYAAILLYYFGYENFREYIQCKLTQPLKTNQVYCCSFYISLADKSTIYTDRIGMFFSQQKIKTKNKLVINKKPQIENTEGLYLKNKEGWTLVCDTFRAIGGEQYLTIGNFHDDTQTDLKTVDNVKEIKKRYPKSFDNDVVDDAYYFIDDISLKAFTDEDDCACKHKIKDNITTFKPKLSDTIVPKAGESFILKNVFFETSNSILLPESFFELDNIATYFKSKEIKSIVVNGYTDNTGNEEDNQKLSEKRAEAVADYLISKGINKNKIRFKGYGETKPIAENKTEEGRAKNRRVEIVFE